MASYESDCKLPSKGKFYENELDTIVFRNLDTDDEQKIYGSSSGTTIDSVLTNCIVSPKGLDVNDLVPADKFFYMVKLRVHTYGSDYKQPYFCPLCNHEGQVTIDLDEDTTVVELPEDYKLPIKIKTPVGKDTLELRVLTQAQINSIRKRAEKMVQRLHDSVSSKEIVFKLRLAKQIVSINDEEVDSFDAEKYVSELHARDRAYIDSAFKAIKFGYESTITVTCPNCKREIVIPFEMTGEFFDPSLEVEFL